jgi:deoxyribonuclease I
MTARTGTRFLLCAILLLAFPTHAPGQDGGVDAAAREDAGAAHERLRVEELGDGPLPPAMRPAKVPRFGSRSGRLLMGLHAPHRTTFYCACAFDGDKRVDPSGCGFEPGARWQNRAERIEWEHVVPASRMLEGRACATDPDRKGSPRRWCRRVDPEFRAMEGDLHNLVPAIGQLNAERADHPYGDIPDAPRRFGACDFAVEDGVVAPAARIRGDIARIYAYMARAYGLELRAEESAMLARWAQWDPPTAEERALWNRTNLVLAVPRRWTPEGWHPFDPIVLGP